MKKIAFFIFTLGILAPISSFAFKADAGENLNISTPVTSDYYIAGGNIDLNSNVDGDVCAAGGKMYINGNIKQDLMAAGGENYINGKIGESARIVGGKINFAGTIEKDLLMAGGDIIMNKSSSIKGETKIAGGKIYFAGTANNVNLNAGEIILKGTIQGDAVIRGGKIEIENGAKILGNLYYESSNQNTGLEQIVSGKTTFKQTYFQHNKKAFLGFFSGFASARFVFLFIFGLILLFVGQKRIRPSLETVKKYPRQSLRCGFLTYILLPIAAIILAITIIGLPFSFVCVVSFITIIIFAKLLNVYFYTNLLIEKWGGYDKLNNRKKIGILLACSIISAILSCIDMILAFFALGAIIKTHIIKKK